MSPLLAAGAAQGRLLVAEESTGAGILGKVAGRGEVDLVEVGEVTERLLIADSRPMSAVTDICNRQEVEAGQGEVGGQS